MKKIINKLSLLATLVLMLIMSCSKSEEVKPVEPSAIYTLVTPEVTPGDVVEVKSDKKLTLPEINIVLNNNTIKAYLTNEFSCVFTLPVIPSGKYDLKMPTIDTNLILNLTVKNYVTIAKPADVITAYIINRDKCFDEMIKNTSVVPSQTSPETLLIIQQIKQEWDFQFSKNSDKDKELLAYVIQKQQISPNWFSFPNDLPANYYNKNSTITLDAGDNLVNVAKDYVGSKIICVGSVPFVIGSAALFLVAPNPITAGIFLVSFSTFIIAKEAAQRNAVRVGSLKGVAEAVSDINVQKTAAIELMNTIEKNIGMNVNFRNLKSTDATIQPDINAAFTGESELVTKDNEVKDLYLKATKITEKLKGLFSSYSPAIGKTPERSMILPVLASEIIVKGSSDPNITVISKMVGSNCVIKVSSTSTQDVNFNLNVAFKRKIDGQEVTKDIACVFKPFNCVYTTLSASAQVNGNTATANATGGTSPYTYLWSNGATTQTVTSLSPGNYNLVVKDAFGCSKKTKDFVIGCKDLPTITSTQWTCDSKGQIAVRVSFTAGTTGILIGSGSLWCDPALTCYPVRLYFLSPGAADWSIAYNGYNVSLISGDKYKGVLELSFLSSWGSCGGLDPLKAVNNSYPNYKWKVELMNQCNERTSSGL